MKGLLRLIVNKATLGIVAYQAIDLVTDSKLLTWESMKNESKRFRSLFGCQSYTKKEIFDILRENGFISEEGLLGIIQGEIFFNEEYLLYLGIHGINSAWYEFEKSKDKKGKYQVVEKFDIA